jgi:ribosomal protein S18 acetylase RimI-like enzyme
VTIVDWRSVDSRALALVFARERARWLVDLGWETRESWLHVERARVGWGLPGLAAIDDSGRVRGLTFFHESGGRYDIGGVFAESDQVREALLDAAVDVCVEAGASEIGAYFYTAKQPMARLLEARGFTHEPVDYLELPLTINPATTRTTRALASIRMWQSSDPDRVAGLLHASYDETEARRFVPDTSLAGWRHYVTTLITHQACGPLVPEATRLAFAGEVLVGAVLVTVLGPSTAHIAQLAVHPDWRRQGLAGALLDDGVRCAREHGSARLTLLVSGSNGAAQMLYRDRGFVPVAAFIAGSRQSAPGVVARAS